MGSATGASRAAPDDFEWFNGWWEQTRPAMNRRAGDAVVSVPRSAGHALAAVTRAALVARDLAEIEKVRDRLFAGTAGSFIRIKAAAEPARPATSTGPVVLGSVVGMMVLAVSSVAAAFMKLAR